MNPDDSDNNFNPPTDYTTPNQREEPAQTIQKIPVPQHIVQAGFPTNEPRNDSPESLDEDIARGTPRQNIDAHHSY